MSMNSNLKVGVSIFYKPTDELKKRLGKYKFLLPVNAGSGLKTDDWVAKNCEFDDSGENISKLNPWFNELTVLYWMWKHQDEIGNPTHLGLFHYRRMFPLDTADKWMENDITTANPITFPGKTLIQQYNRFHILSDLDKLFQAVKDIHGEGESSFIQTYMDSMVMNFAPLNMFVMKKHYFNEWCEYMFPVAFELERLIGRNVLDSRDNYQRRAICFLVERLFGFWAYEKRLECSFAQVPVVENLEWKPPKVNERGDYTR